MNYNNILLKTYRKELWSKFMKAISDYNLIEANDVIGVCISGGKDSMLLASLLKTLQQFLKIPFTLKFITMDPGYKEDILKQVKDNAKKLNIELNIYNSPIFDYVETLEKNPCYICARMRRGYLYSFAKDLNCNKIALGHHFDDVIETTLINMFYAGQIGTMLPKLTSTSNPDLQLIRPLYYIEEKDIIRWSKYIDIDFIKCACRFTETQCNSKTPGKRQEIKALIDTYNKTNPNFKSNIFRSMENIKIEKVLSYQDLNHNLYSFEKIFNSKKSNNQ